jgi:hypothetical protein
VGCGVGKVITRLSKEAEAVFLRDRVPLWHRSERL